MHWYTYKNTLIDSGDNTYLTINSLIDINNIINGLNINLRKANFQPYRYDKMYIEKDLIEDKLSEIIASHFSIFSTLSQK